jgi:hypothetical protein
VTPGIHVSKLVRIDHVATEAGGFKTNQPFAKTGIA